MRTNTRTRDRRTSVDEIFDHLYEEISKLRLRPGDKISESEIATRFGVSRQPVRDAFSRLENLDLISIRPQRATEVKRFSLTDIEKSRFVRCAIETEVLRRAAASCNKKNARQLNEHLEKQIEASDSRDCEQFGKLDYQFHQLLCAIGRVEFAFDVIRAEKASVDRLCMLSLSKEHRMPQLINDHREMADALIDGDADRAVAAGTLHLSRLDDTINAIVEASGHYFE
jgi:DNA-binding GntR family transcriptional regulator